MYSALAIHFVLGAILGFIARIATSSRSQTEQEEGAEESNKNNDTLH